MTTSTESMKDLDTLVDSFLDYALSHGLTVRPGSFENPRKTFGEHAPITLFPSKFPATAFEEACQIQELYNELYAAISRDEDWLGSVMNELAKVDTFVGRLWKLHKEVKDEGITQPLSLGLFRSDYILHVSSPSELQSPVIKQVEFNTVAASFAGLATKVAEAHAYFQRSGSYEPIVSIPASSIAENHALDGLATGLAKAHQAYGVSDAKILFVVQHDERNIFDQRWLEYRLFEKFSDFCLGKSTDHRETSVSMEEKTRKLLLEASPTLQEISVVYLRAGYGPDDYSTEQDWQTRALLERSHAIKCPSIATQLAGTKKVQQVLAKEGIVERFIKSRTAVKRLCDTFAGLYPLDDSFSGIRGRELAFACPEFHVLKPQREGGGNNVYRRSIPEFLQRLPQAQWSAYILMELISAPVSENTLLRNGVPVHMAVIDEIGIYGAVLWNTQETVWNSGCCGYLVRTKSTDSQEGGVAAGYGCLSSLQRV
ncbi:Glutathione synthetase [Neolecta irregularis DAH-3]|uniref:Glutathione synthetase n=1 Tax=Neolecta irregularis (strain DAH-3) TaxID=1198029 RepID=A0A1U7LWJ7_NEOID|nr:Glutathione synthetase [Neolecta irregularis DAH-3]|eukprot:OLL26999.1 Glutathione synthetase [Neolecta irregularis DAH-3]